MNIFKSIGFEVELFLTKKGVNHETIVYNAHKELNNILGFSINPNIYGESSFLKMDSVFNSTLTTDGTPVEFAAYRTFGENAFDSFLLNSFIDDELKLIDRISKHLLKDFTLSWDCYKSSIPNLVIFDSPGNVFASEKEVYNAYTGDKFLQQKKEENKLVTVRTTGLHLHFEFKDETIIENQSQTDLIVRELDKILYNYYKPFLGFGYTEREKEFQKKGLYRIKKQLNGIKTLEYRQLTPKMLNNKQVMGFILQADNVIHNLLENP